MQPHVPKAVYGAFARSGQLLPLAALCRGVSRCLGSANKDKVNAGGGGLAAAGGCLGNCQIDSGVGRGGVRRGDRHNANVFGEAIVE